MTKATFGANKANNVAASSSTLAVTIPQLTLGTPATGQLTAIAPDQYYQITPPAGQSLVVTVNSSAASGQIELYVMRGGLPTPYDFDFAAHTSGATQQTITVPTTQAGVYYILIHGVSGAVLSSPFTLTATEPGLDYSLWV